MSFVKFFLLVWGLHGFEKRKGKKGKLFALNYILQESSPKPTQKEAERENEEVSIEAEQNKAIV